MADDISDEDDDTFVTFGTAVEIYEEDAPRKKPVPVHEQIVTDSQGRRRFHGAFSGGFSAGYFNTVGTKEGWSPSIFVSSRSKKNDQTRQKPEDFMDEEDFSEFGIAPKKITTTGDFLPTRQELKRRQPGWESSGDADSVGASREVIPGVPPLQHLVVPARLSVGVKLLKEMGWREGQGIGPRVRRTRKKIYGCVLQPAQRANKCSDDDDDVYAAGILFAPKDVEEFTFAPKDDLHGLGYKGIDVSSALVQNTRGDILGVGVTRNYFGKVKGIKGQAFGVGAFEEDDDDIYGTDNMSRYDIQLTTESKTRSSDYHGWTGPPKQNQACGLLSIFAVASKPLVARQYFPPPVLPKDYKPFHSTQSSERQQNLEPRQQTEKCRLTVAERGKILGETLIPEPKKSVFEYVAKEDKQRLKDTREYKELESGRNSEVAGCQTAGGRSTFKPFVKEPLKQERYERYLRIRAGQKDTSVLPASGLTEWEREREREAFSRAAILYQPLSSAMAARFTSAKQPDEHNKVYEEVPAEEGGDACDQAKAAAMKMFGLMTREKFEWHPDRLLCKRFNIPDPYPGSHVTGVPKIRREKFSLEDFVTVSAPKAVAHTQPPSVACMESNLNDPSVTAVTTSRSSSRFSSVQQLVASQESDTSSLPLVLADHGSGETEKQNTDNNVNKVPHEDIGKPKERPPMDLFKAIFADSSSDESKESESEEETPELAMQNVGSEAVAPDQIQPDSTVPPQVSPSEPVVVQGKDKELPPLQFIPRTKLTVKGGEGELEKEKLDLDTDEYGPALPSSSRHTGLDPSRVAISEKNLFYQSVVSRHCKKKRKHKKMKDNETDTSDEDSKSRFTMKDSKRRVERKKSDASSRKHDANSEFKKNEGFSVEKFGTSSSKHSGVKERRTKRSRTLDFCSESSKKKVETVSTKSSQNDHSYSSDSTLDSSENYLPYKSVESRFGESKKTASFDKRDVFSRERKHKHKKKKRHSSPDYRDEHQQRDKGKHRDKKHKRKGKEKGKGDRMKPTERTPEEPAKQMTASDSKQILAKLKSIQDLREQKRKRAADFM